MDGWVNGWMVGWMLQQTIKSSSTRPKIYWFDSSELRLVPSPLNVTLANGSERLRLLARWRTHRNMVRTESTGVQRSARLKELTQPSDSEVMEFRSWSGSRTEGDPGLDQRTRLQRPVDKETDGKIGGTKKSVAFPQASVGLKKILKILIFQKWSWLSADCPPCSSHSTGSVCRVKPPFLCFCDVLRLCRWGKWQFTSGTHTSHPKETSTFPVVFSSLISWLFPSHPNICQNNVCFTPFAVFYP